MSDTAAHATQEDTAMTIDTATAEAARIETGRWSVARVSGRYRVVDNGGAIFATVASKAAGQKWIDRKVQAAVDLAEEAVREQARLAEERAAEAAAATMATPEEAAAQVAAEATPAADEKAKAVRFHGRVHRLLLAASRGAEVAPVLARLDAAKTLTDGGRSIPTTLAERIELHRLVSGLILDGESQHDTALTKADLNSLHAFLRSAWMADAAPVAA